MHCYASSTLLLVTASVLRAQAPQPPVLDFFFDHAQHALRPAIGSLGASYVASAMNVGTLSTAAVAPGGGYALAVAAESGNLMLLRMGLDATTSVPVNAPPGAGKIAMSPLGRSAVLLYSGSAAALVVTGLPDSPRVLRSVSLPGSRALPMMAAVSDDGGALLLVTSQLRAPSAAPGPGRANRPVLATSLVVNTSTGSAMLDAMTAVSAVAFLPDTQDAIFADRARVFRLHAGAQGSEPELLAAQSVASPIAGLAVSGDRGRIFAAFTNGDVAQVNSSAGAFDLIGNCSCVPGGMFRMRGNARFRLSELPGETVWVLNAESQAAHLTFIPVDSHEETAALGRDR